MHFVLPWGILGDHTNTNMSFLDIWYLMPFMDSMAMIWINNSESHLLVNSWSWGLSWFIVDSLNIAIVGVEYALYWNTLYMFHQPPILCNQANGDILIQK